MPGTLANAEVALFLEVTEARYAAMEVAPGWEFLGNGVSRIAFLGPDNVVYKVGHGSDSFSNNKEYQRMMDFATRPLDGWAFPECERFVVDGCTVLAVEFLGDERPDIPRKETSKAETHFGLSDLHNGNLRIGDDGKFYIIDAGE